MFSLSLQIVYRQEAGNIIAKFATFKMSGKSHKRGKVGKQTGKFRIAEAVHSNARCLNLGEHNTKIRDISQNFIRFKSSENNF